MADIPAEFDAVDHQIAEEMRAEWARDGEEAHGQGLADRQITPLELDIRDELKRALDRVTS